MSKKISAAATGRVNGMPTIAMLVIDAVDP